MSADRPRVTSPLSSSRDRRRRRTRWSFDRLEDRTLLAVSVATSTRISVSTATAVYGQPITLTATVTAESPGAATPTAGTVTFLNGRAVLGAAKLVNGSAAIPTVLNAVGTHTITAVYSGTSEFAGSGAGVITTVAGTGTLGSSGDGGPATSAALGDPMGIAFDAAGDLFIADTFNNVVREVVAATGDIITVAGGGSQASIDYSGPATSAELLFPEGVAVDAAGNLFIADTDHNVIREVIKSTSTATALGVAVGTIITVAGNGSYGYSGDVGPASIAALSVPVGVAVDAAGNLFVADSGNNVIREVVNSTSTATALNVVAGDMITVAGKGTYGYSGDGGPATNAALDFPEGVAVDARGDLFIADSGNNVIRAVVKTTGKIVTVAGTGTAGSSGEGGPAASAALADPFGVAVDAAGDLFIADDGNDSIREVVKATGKMIVVAGTGTAGSSGAGGPATSAALNVPAGVAVDAAGDIFIADTANNLVRRVTLPAQVVVNAAATSTTVSAVTSSAVYGQQVTFTATVKVNAPSTAGPTGGTITFLDGSITLGTALLVNGTATSPQVPLLNGVGVNTITAIYSGDSNFAGSTADQITTVAGIVSRGPNGDGGPATKAALAQPVGVVVDAAGDLFIADGDHNVIREVVHATGKIITIAGNGVGAGPGTGGYSGDGGPATNAELDDPLGVALDAAGDLFIADTINNRIREVVESTSTAIARDVTVGTIITVAGGGINGPSVNNVPATSAELIFPSGIAFDKAGDLFIADSGNNVIREVNPDGTISTVAGGGTQTFIDYSGPATSAEFNHPSGIAVDAAGDIFIADSYNNVIREVNPDGTISTVAGNGYEAGIGFGFGGYTGDGGPATSAELKTPSGIALDKAGDIFIADSFNHVVREVVSATGTMITVAGNSNAGYIGDDGPATSAEFNAPTGVAVGAAGDLFVADSPSNVIRELVESNSSALALGVTVGTIITVAGNGTELNGPSDVAVDAAGDLFIADANNSVIREIVHATGELITVAGSGIAGYTGDGGPATLAEIGEPEGITVDAAGDLFIDDVFNDVIREVVAATGTISTVAGNGFVGYIGDHGPATKAELRLPSGMAVDAAGDLFIADAGNNTIREVVESAHTASALGLVSGDIITVAGNSFAGHSGDGGPATNAELDYPLGVAVDKAGDLFIADSANNVIREVKANGTISTVAGNGYGAGSGSGGYRGDGGPATNAELKLPIGVAVDAMGNLFITDSSNNVVREVNHADGTISTVAGYGASGYSGDGAPATSGELYAPEGLAVNAAGDIFIADTGNNLIRGVLPPVLPTTPVQVGPAQTSTTVGVPTGPVFLGQPITLTATVTADSPSTATPTGSVTFFEDGVSIGTESLVDGTASLTGPLDAPLITAIYNGDQDFEGSPGDAHVIVALSAAVEAATLLAFDFGSVTAAEPSVEQGAQLQPLVETGLALVATLTIPIPSPLAARPTLSSDSDEVGPGAAGAGGDERGQVPAAPAVLSPPVRLLMGLDEAFERTRLEARRCLIAAVGQEDPEPAGQAWAVWDALLGQWSPRAGGGEEPAATPLQGTIRTDRQAAQAVDAALRDLAGEGVRATRPISTRASEAYLPSAIRPEENPLERAVKLTYEDVLTVIAGTWLGFELVALGLTGGVRPSRARHAALRRRRSSKGADPRPRSGSSRDPEARPPFGGRLEIDVEPTPDFAAELAEECRLRLDALSKENLRQVAVLKMEGYTDDEVAKELKCTRRSVQRKLVVIRHEWSA